MTAKPQLDRNQQSSLDRAKEVLAAEHEYDSASMAGRIGALEWHLGELLSLVGILTGGSK